MGYLLLRRCVRVFWTRAAWTDRRLTFYSYDPPVALTETDDPAGPLSAAEPTITTALSSISTPFVDAQPSSSPAQPTPAATSAPSPSATDAQVTPSFGSSSSALASDSTAATQDSTTANKLQSSITEPVTSAATTETDDFSFTYDPSGSDAISSAQTQTVSTLSRTNVEGLVNAIQSAAANTGAIAAINSESSDEPLTSSNGAQALVIGSQTASAGGDPVIVSGTTYSIPPSGTALVVNGATQTLVTGSGETGAGDSGAGVPGTGDPGTGGVGTDVSPTADDPSPLTYTLGNYVAGSQTIVPGGGGIVVSGTTYSLARSATALFIDGVPSSMGPPAGSTPAVLDLGSIQLSQIASSSGQAVYADSSMTVTVVAMSPAASTLGQTRNAASATTHVISTAANGQLVTVPTASVISGAHGTGSTNLDGSQTVAQSGHIASEHSTVTIGGSMFATFETTNPQGHTLEIAGSDTLTIGGSAKTVDGQIASAGTAGLVIGTSTVALTTPNPSEDPTVTIGGSIFAAFETTDAQGYTVDVVGSHTLTVGGTAKTIDGQLVSAGTAGLVIGTSTVALTTFDPSSTPSTSLSPTSLSLTTAGASASRTGVAKSGSPRAYDSGLSWWAALALLTMMTASSTVVWP